MFERYDEPARRVIFFARFEAGAFGAGEIDTEHLLLGLFRQDQQLLDRLVGEPINVELIRQNIRSRSAGGETPPTSADMPLSTAAKRVLSHLFDEANWLNHDSIGTEHVLLGLLLEESAAAAEILRGLGLNVEMVRKDLAKPAGSLPSNETQRWDSAADRVIIFAHHEASARGAAEASAEELLLGLMRQEMGLFHRLAGVYIDESALSAIRAAAVQPASLDDDASAKRVLSHALDEANLLNHEKIGTEHLLLGLLLEETSTAAGFLRGMGLSVEKVRDDLAGGTAKD